MTIIDAGTQGTIEVGIEERQVFLVAYPPGKNPPAGSERSYRFSLDQARTLRDELSRALEEASK